VLFGRNSHSVEFAVEQAGDGLGLSYRAGGAPLTGAA